MTNTPPPPPPPPPSYGAPPPGYGGDASVHEYPGGTTILVLGIVSLIICGVVLGPIALVKGSKARKEMAAQPGVTWTNKGIITAGWICGIIGTVGGVLLLVYGIQRA